MKYYLSSQGRIAVISFMFCLVSCGDGAAKKPNTNVVNAQPTPVKQPNVIVIFTDDQGYADLGIQDIDPNLKTPNIDQLAQNGVRFTNGYITSPQCSPSRAAMITGKHQASFGMDENRYIPMTKDVSTLGERFQSLGYKTGVVGKWHLEVTDQSKEWGAENHSDIVPFTSGAIPLEIRRDYLPERRGFDDMFVGYSGKYWTNFLLNGETSEADVVTDSRFRVDVASDAALTFIDRNWQQPFYLHVAHYGPHFPIEATEEYLSRFSDDMPVRRRYALAMMAAIDDGVGRIMSKLTEYEIADDTLVFFISDNGAPLGDDMTDAPINNTREAWNGSVNTPYTGEKGMLTEGGLRVPYIVQWPQGIPAGLVIDEPVSSLDAAFTALKAAGYDKMNELDGVDLLPAISGDGIYLNERPQFWRFYFQRAVRLGQWKYMQAGIAREYLFDMYTDETETRNVIEQYPEIAQDLKDRYWDWSSKMEKPEPLVEIPAPFAARVDFYLPSD